MCGIFGIVRAGKNLVVKNNLSKFIEDAFITSCVRGLDSSGVMQIDKSRQLYIHKMAVMGPLFLDNKTTKQYVRDAGDNNVTVCHVRAATVGRVAADNAHPFMHIRDGSKKSERTRVAGVHNGTLSTFNTRCANRSEYSVDSEWAIDHIAKEGADAFEDFSGAYSFVWWDENNPDVLNFARNKERPMHWLFSKDRKIMLFASEHGMLAWLAQRNEIDVEDKIYSTTTDQLYTVNFGGDTIEVSKAALPSFRAFTMGSSTASNTSQTSHYSQQYGQYGIYGDDSDWGDYSCGYSSKATQDKLVDSCRAILRANGKEEGDTVGTSVGVDDGDTVGSEASPLNYKAQADWYSTINATTVEIANARRSNSFGELVWFDGILYEPETSEMEGEFAEYLGKDRITHRAILRGLSAAAASRKYDKGNWGVVVGQYKNNQDGHEYFVLAPLNEKGNEAMAA